MVARPVRGLRLVLATTNPDKAAEIRSILLEVGLEAEVLPRPSGIPDVVEDGATLEENARKKAEAVGRATGFIAVADDTGLFVDALGGAPGVRSARYASEKATYVENCSKLLLELSGVANRRATFRTIAVARLESGEVLVATGEVGGVITTEPRGSNGFGYDPVFVPDQMEGRSFAELTPELKDSISHRGRAFRALAARLRELRC